MSELLFYSECDDMDFGGEDGGNSVPDVELGGGRYVKFPDGEALGKTASNSPPRLDAAGVILMGITLALLSDDILFL